MGWVGQLLDTWGTWLVAMSAALSGRFAWWLWRRLTGKPVPFLGQAITRIADGVASVVLLGNTAAGLYMRAKLSEALEHRKDVLLEEANARLAVAIEMLAEQGISPKDLESRRGSDGSSVYLGDLIEPMPSKPSSRRSSRNTSASPAKRRRNRRSDTSATP